MRWAWTKFGGIFLCIGNSDIHLRQHVWASMPFLYPKQNWNNPTKMRAVVCEVQTFPYSSFSISLNKSYASKSFLVHILSLLDIQFNLFLVCLFFFRYLYSFLICSTCSPAILLSPNSDSQPISLKCFERI